jgi:hypothetical protein
MKIKSTGIANMNMWGELDKIYSEREADEHFLIMDIKIKKPRNWEVTVKMDANDFKKLFINLLTPKTILLMMEFIIKKSSK